MKKPVKTIVLFLLLGTLLLAACAPPSDSIVEAPALLLAEEGAEVPAADSQQAVPDGTASEPFNRSGEKKILTTGSLTQKDNQGAVTVVVTPLDLSQVDGALEFDVIMDTHSVDLSMDLSVLATLSTDTGQSITPSQWDAPSGGHHIKGTLTFPVTVDDSSILDDGSTITLTLRNIDVPVREFTWIIPLNKDM